LRESIAAAVIVLRATSTSTLEPHGGNVVSISRCMCGAIGRPVACTIDDMLVHEFYACTGCFDEARDAIDRATPAFYALLAAGFDRELANETMSFLIGRVLDL
jgi:hypothetical protein